MRFGPVGLLATVTSNDRQRVVKCTICLCILQYTYKYLRLSKRYIYIYVCTYIHFRVLYEAPEYYTYIYIYHVYIIRYVQQPPQYFPSYIHLYTYTDLSSLFFRLLFIPTDPPIRPKQQPLLPTPSAHNASRDALDVRYLPIQVKAGWSVKWKSDSELFLVQCIWASPKKKYVGCTLEFS